MIPNFENLLEDLLSLKEEHYQTIQDLHVENKFDRLIDDISSKIW